jgi:hypothetical protein
VIPFGQANILREPRVKGNREEIEFRARKVTEGSTECVELDFVLLNQEDGALIEVIHANPGSIGNPRHLIKGIKNIGRIKEFKPPKKTSFIAQYKNMDAAIVSVSLVAFTVLLLITAGEQWRTAVGIVVISWAVSALLLTRSYLNFTRFPSWARGESTSITKADSVVDQAIKKEIDSDRS